MLLLEYKKMCGDSTVGHGVNVGCCIGFWIILIIPIYSFGGIEGLKQKLTVHLIRQGIGKARCKRYSWNYLSCLGI